MAAPWFWLFVWILWLEVRSMAQIWGNNSLNSRDKLNDRPIIGVLVLELSKAMRKELGEDSNRYQSHLPASYVKFVEGSGGRVVPIMIGRKKKYYKNLMKSLNGVLFPGGAVNFEDADGYAAAGANLLDLATEANRNGDYFPVWGTCLGFQLLTYLAAGRREHRADCFSTQQTLPLEFRTDFRDSKMFRNAPDHVIEILKTKDVNANFHSYCVTEKNMTKMGLIPDWRILATNHDLNGLEFVSVIESHDFPYYGVIAHPEKNPYEFNPTRNYPHSAGAVMVAQFFANFFVDEARKSSHQFSEPTEERESLIYNFEPVHTGARSIFEQTYFFREKLP